MAVLKYKNGEGEFVTLTNYTVQPITPKQETGTSMSDVMSQKATSDELAKKVNSDELNGKVADAISGNAAVKDAIAGVVESSPAISGAINSVVSSAITSDDAVKDAVDKAVADAIKTASAVTDAVEDVVDGKLADYYDKTQAEAAFAPKAHRHNVSDIDGFDEQVAESVKTEITNNNTAITESIESVVEKYIYGEGQTPSETAKVVTTDNLQTTLAEYAKADAVPTKVSQLENDENYVKQANVNTLVENAIKNDTTVQSAVDDAVASAISSSQVVKDAVAAAISADTTVASKADASAVTANADAIGKLNGGAEVEGSVKNTVASEIAKVVAEAPEDFDTLKEIADWIASDKTSATTMSNDIASNKANIATVSGDLKTHVENADIHVTAAQKAAWDAKADANHTHAASAITGLDDAIAEGIASDDSVKEAVNKAVATAITSSDVVQSAITQAVSGKADMSAITQNYYTKTEAAGEFAAKNHTHAASEITDFATATEGVVSTSTTITNTIKDVVATAVADNNSAVNEAINNAVEAAVSGNTDVKASVESVIDGKLVVYYNKDEVDTALAGKQNTLVSGTSIKTLNGESLLGSGNITIQAAGTIDTAITEGSANAVAGGAVFTALQGKADSAHTHTAAQVTDLAASVNTIVASAVTDNTDVNEAINNAVASAVSASSGSVKESIDNAIATSTAVTTAASNASAAKAVTDFYSGHEAVTSLLNIPTTKRLVIATISDNTNELSLSENALTDGYEIHVIINNGGEQAITITLPTSGNYKLVGNAITIEANKYGEVNIISDGTNLYVRGA